MGTAGRVSVKRRLRGSRARFGPFGEPEAGSPFALFLPEGFISHFQAHSGQPSAEKCSENPSIRKSGPVYTRIGNSLTASSQSANRAVLVANRNTILRA